MARMATSAETDYLLIDGLETITLTREGAAETVENVGRGVLIATNQATGQQAGDTRWVISESELVGTITAPMAGDEITGADGSSWVLTSASYQQLKKVFDCTATRAAP